MKALSAEEVSGVTLLTRTFTRFYHVMPIDAGCDLHKIDTNNELQDDDSDGVSTKTVESEVNHLKSPHGKRKGSSLSAHLLKVCRFKGLKTDRTRRPSSRGAY